MEAKINELTVHNTPIRPLTTRGPIQGHHQDERRIDPGAFSVLVIQVRPGRRYRQHLTAVGVNHIKRWCDAMGEQQYRDLAKNVF